MTWGCKGCIYCVPLCYILIVVALNWCFWPALVVFCFLPLTKTRVKSCSKNTYFSECLIIWFVSFSFNDSSIWASLTPPVCVNTDYVLQQDLNSLSFSRRKNIWLSVQRVTWSVTNVLIWLVQNIVHKIYLSKHFCVSFSITFWPCWITTVKRMCACVIYWVIMKKDCLTDWDYGACRVTLIASKTQPKYIWKERFLLGRNNDWVGQKAWPPSARSYKRTDCVKAP